MFINRQRFLQNTALTGLSALTFPSLVANSNKSLVHHLPKAKSVIFCYMSGGVSHVDSFDPKPMLKRLHGKSMTMKVEKTQFDQNGKIMQSPWGSKAWGQCGREMTTLFPHIGSCADDIAVIRSMSVKFSEHAQGNFFMHSGFPFMGYPSAGAWMAYGLGQENLDLPGHIVLRNETGIPHGGPSIFGSAFLPATTEGSMFHIHQASTVNHIKNARPYAVQRKNLDLISKLDRNFSKRVATSDHILSGIDNYETAYRMQQSVPEACNIQNEPEYIKRMYGMRDKDPIKVKYGEQALVARRLVERGVRFIELTCSNFKGDRQKGNPWDQHGAIAKGHAAMAHQVDEPIAGLIQDLKQRGLFEQTLIVFTGEFGRTPFSQGSDGRDHNPYAFSLWLAGGGVKGGTTYGSSDELGYHAVENKSSVYDLWATVLHLCGLNHEKLTYRFGGRDLRLTDVHGHIWKEILA